MKSEWIEWPEESKNSNGLPLRFLILQRTKKRCSNYSEGCEEPPAIEIQLGYGAEIKICFECYELIKDEHWPELIDLRRLAGWNI